MGLNHKMTSYGCCNVIRNRLTKYGVNCWRCKLKCDVVKTQQGESTAYGKFIHFSVALESLCRCS